MSKHDAPQGAPPSYPPQAHYDAGPVPQGGASNDYYGQQQPQYNQGGYPPQQYNQGGYDPNYNQGYPPQGYPQGQPMQYQQGPYQQYPPGGVPQDRGGGSGAGGCCAGDE
ncbi:hypothetical protein Slin15195_G092540 [Septoria linicola]|uniref:Uncharacterized protein n=1 Tax=Septoria linicola TaxID=215465 RepID=A0A9Q9EMD9_9PEZI|nr:hypothetical protein Slin15195_G092540 [Septoria linicola]